MFRPLRACQPALAAAVVMCAGRTTAGARMSHGDGLRHGLTCVGRLPLHSRACSFPVGPPAWARCYTTTTHNPASATPPPVAETATASTRDEHSVSLRSACARYGVATTKIERVGQPAERLPAVANVFLYDGRAVQRRVKDTIARAVGLLAEAQLKERERAQAAVDAGRATNTDPSRLVDARLMLHPLVVVVKSKLTTKKAQEMQADLESMLALRGLSPATRVVVLDKQHSKSASRYLPPQESSPVVLPEALGGPAVLTAMAAAAAEVSSTAANEVEPQEQSEEPHADSVSHADAAAEDGGVGVEDAGEEFEEVEEVEVIEVDEEEAEASAAADSGRATHAEATDDEPPATPEASDQGNDADPTEGLDGGAATEERTGHQPLSDTTTSTAEGDAEEVELVEEIVEVEEVDDDAEEAVTAHTPGTPARETTAADEAGETRPDASVAPSPTPSSRSPSATTTTATAAAAVEAAAAAAVVENKEEPPLPVPPELERCSTYYMGAPTVYLSDRAGLDLPAVANVLVVDAVESMTDASAAEVRASMHDPATPLGYLLTQPEPFVPAGDRTVVMDANPTKVAMLPKMFVFRTALSAEGAREMQRAVAAALNAGRGHERSTVCVLCTSASAEVNPLLAPPTATTTKRRAATATTPPSAHSTGPSLDAVRSEDRTDAPDPAAPTPSTASAARMPTEKEEENQKAEEAGDASLSPFAMLSFFTGQTLATLRGHLRRPAHSPAATPAEGIEDVAASAATSAAPTSTPTTATTTTTTTTTTAATHTNRTSPTSTTSTATPTSAPPPHEAGDDLDEAAAREARIDAAVAQVVAEMATPTTARATAAAAPSNFLALPPLPDGGGTPGRPASGHATHRFARPENHAATPPPTCFDDVEVGKRRDSRGLVYAAYRRVREGRATAADRAMLQASSAGGAAAGEGSAAAAARPLARPRMAPTHAAQGRAPTQRGSRARHTGGHGGLLELLNAGSGIRVILERGKQRQAGASLRAGRAAKVAAARAAATAMEKKRTSHPSTGRRGSRQVRRGAAVVVKRSKPGRQQRQRKVGATARTRTTSALRGLPGVRITVLEVKERRRGGGGGGGVAPRSGATRRRRRAERRSRSPPSPATGLVATTLSLPPVTRRSERIFESLPADTRDAIAHVHARARSRPEDPIRRPARPVADFLLDREEAMSTLTEGTLVYPRAATERCLRPYLPSYAGRHTEVDGLAPVSTLVCVSEDLRGGASAKSPRRIAAMPWAVSMTVASVMAALTAAECESGDMCDVVKQNRKHCPSSPKHVPVVVLIARNHLFSTEECREQQRLVQESLQRQKNLRTARVFVVSRR